MLELLNARVIAVVPVYPIHAVDGVYIRKYLRLSNLVLMALMFIDIS